MKSNPHREAQHMREGERTTAHKATTSSPSPQRNTLSPTRTERDAQGNPVTPQQLPATAPRVESIYRRGRELHTRERISELSTHLLTTPASSLPGDNPVETPVEGEQLICHLSFTHFPGCGKEHPRQASPSPPLTFNKASPTTEKLSHSGRDRNHPSTHTRSSLHVTSNHSSHSQDMKHPSAISPAPLLQHFTSSFPAHHKTSHAPSYSHKHSPLTFAIASSPVENRTQGKQ